MPGGSYAINRIGPANAEHSFYTIVPDSNGLNNVLYGKPDTFPQYVTPLTALNATDQGVPYPQTQNGRPGYPIAFGYSKTPIVWNYVSATQSLNFNMLFNNTQVVFNPSINYTMSMGAGNISSTRGGDEGGPVFWNDFPAIVGSGLYVGAALLSTEAEKGFEFLSSTQYDWACRNRCDVPY